MAAAAPLMTDEEISALAAEMTRSLLAQFGERAGGLGITVLLQSQEDDRLCAHFSNLSHTEQLAQLLMAAVATAERMAMAQMGRAQLVHLFAEGLGLPALLVPIARPPEKADG